MVSCEGGRLAHLSSVLRFCRKCYGLKDQCKPVAFSFAEDNFVDVIIGGLFLRSLVFCFKTTSDLSFYM